MIGLRREQRTNDDPKMRRSHGWYASRAVVNVSGPRYGYSYPLGGPVGKLEQ